ncbi:MAG: transglycosylase domain-containing protein, partial [Bacteroidota bacterium]
MSWLTGFIHRLKDRFAIRRKRFLYAIAVVLLLLLFFYWRWLPDPLFNDPASTVILDRSGQLLGAKISSDQQWRFPECDKVPEKFRQAIVQYEDQYFWFHPGFNPVALIRAAYLNFSHHRIVSGGSTITMQVIRLARENRERTYLEKIRE